MRGFSSPDSLLSLFRQFRFTGDLKNGQIGNVPSSSAGRGSMVVSRLQEIITGSDHESVLFQSVLVACIQTVRRARIREEQVSGASISLAQNEMLQMLLDELTAVEEVLLDALTDQGKAMLKMSKARRLDLEQDRWWYALSEAIQELEEGTERVSTLVGNQPRGTEARLLAGSIVRLLHKHHAQLVVEAEEWMA